MSFGVELSLVNLANNIWNSGPDNTPILIDEWDPTPQYRRGPIDPLSNGAGINQRGRYRVDCKLGCVTSSPQRPSVGLRFAINGNVISPNELIGDNMYIRNYSNHKKSSAMLSWFIDLQEGQILGATRERLTVPGTLTAPAGNSYLRLVRI